MKQQRDRHAFSTLMMSLFLGATVFATPSVAMNSSQHSSDRTSTNKTLAQTSYSCHQVIAKRGLYVREKPTVYSNAVGVIAYRRNVEVAGGITNGWVPISAPLKGYVYADWIGRCQAASPPPSTCRRVVAQKGIPVRREPSSNSKTVGYISSGRRVILTGQGENGWVPISVPFKGYVPSDQLVYCRNFPSSSS